MGKQWRTDKARPKKKRKRVRSWSHVWYNVWKKKDPPPVSLSLSLFLYVALHIMDMVWERKDIGCPQVYHHWCVHIDTVIRTRVYVQKGFYFLSSFFFAIFSVCWKLKDKKKNEKKILDLIKGGKMICQDNLTSFCWTCQISNIKLSVQVDFFKSLR